MSLLTWLTGRKPDQGGGQYARPVGSPLADEAPPRQIPVEMPSFDESLPQDALMTGTDARIVSLATERQARVHPRSVGPGNVTSVPGNSSQVVFDTPTADSSAFRVLPDGEGQLSPSPTALGAPLKSESHAGLALVTKDAGNNAGITEFSGAVQSVTTLANLHAKLGQAWRGLLEGVVTQEFAAKCVPLDLTCGHVALLVTADMMDTAHMKVVRNKLEREWLYRIQHQLVGPPELVSQVYADCRLRAEKGVNPPHKIDTRFLRLYDDIEEAAIEALASDIHFETVHGKGLVWLRVYGKLRPWLPLNADLLLNSLGAAFGSRIKESTSSKEQFSSKVPINFMTRQLVAGRKWEGRCNGRPHQTGYKLVQRLLESEVRADRIPTLKQLGYSESHVAMLDMALLRQWGVILMIGGTGSGKSTTLRTMMVHLPGGESMARYSVESPAEYEMPGVIQYSVPVDVNDTNEEMTLKYTALLRDAMRQDPDALMMGEIRDHQTARLAVEFAATDHRCLTTLHGPDVVGGLERLAGEELAIPADTLSGARFLNAGVYQRLLPKLCKCRLPATHPGHGVPASKREVLAKKYELDVGTFFVANPQGCAHCKPKVPGLSANGTLGVTVAAEILIPTSAMHSLIAARNWPGLRRAWRDQRRSSFATEDALGKTAFEHGLWLCAQGVVSLVDLEKEFEPLESYEVFPISQAGGGL